MTNRDWAHRADQLAARAYADGEPTAWFDRLYAEGAAGAIDMPWDRSEPHARLVEWYRRWAPEHPPGRACVVGCGLGADAEFLAAHGWTTTAFDLSPNAIEQARLRSAGAVTYRVADLLRLPDDLVGAFDLVLEIHTLQAMPDPPRRGAAGGVASLLAGGGTLLAIGLRDVGVASRPPPFPLTRDDLRLLEVGDVIATRVEELDGPLWLAEFVRRGARV